MCTANLRTTPSSSSLPLLGWAQALTQASGLGSRVTGRAAREGQAATPFFAPSFHLNTFGADFNPKLSSLGYAFHAKL